MKSHELCDAVGTGQLARSTNVDRGGAGHAAGVAAGASAVEIAENIAGDSGPVILDLREGADPSAYAGLASGLVGLTAQPADWFEAETLANAGVTDPDPAWYGDADPVFASPGTCERFSRATGFW